MTASHPKIWFKLNPYPGHGLNKVDCIGHVQKRVGARLCNYKAYHKEVLWDGKKLCGAGRLTNKAILQNYYGMIIRGNIGDLYQMKKGIAAILYHCSEYLVQVGDDKGKKVPDNNVRHKYCPVAKILGANTHVLLYTCTSRFHKQLFELYHMRPIE